MITPKEERNRISIFEGGCDSMPGRNKDIILKVSICQKVLGQMGKTDLSTSQIDLQY